MKEIENVSYIGKPLSNTVLFVTKKVDYLIKNLETVDGCLVFVEDTIDIPKSIKYKHEFVSTAFPQRDYASYITKIAEKIEKNNATRKYIYTKSGYYLGENVLIGNNAVIEPGCFIGHDVVIGDNAMIKAGAIIKNANIGNNFIACENCTIGSTGFTMTNDDSGNKIRIPTLGKVIIGNNVEIGALSNVSCGMGGNTIISDNVKLDSLVHVGHDDFLAKNVELPAGVILSGFVIIGENVFVGINSSIRNRISIGSNAFIGMGAVVTKNVVSGETVVGNPARPYAKEK